MVLSFTSIARVTDGLLLAASTDDDTVRPSARARGPDGMLMPAVLAMFFFW